MNFDEPNNVPDLVGTFSIGFTTPREGAVLAVDGFVLHKSGRRPDLAHRFIDFMLEGRNAADAEFVSLTAGLGTRVDASGRVAQAHAVDTQALTAWRSGKLVFNNASLSEVVEEVSRYREKPLTVSNDKIGQLRLTSVFKSDNTEALLKALPNILPVAVRTHADGSQEIISK